ncbi:ABC transporter permease [Streptomyces sp. ISID311]|uniref:ABC transporter permease n=1 Tax=Streptomyces sp. ISID311 TaxID=2601673 RepID=UPI0011BD4407|nr:ABC transporter permease [Streptomyces sp. ISID311]TXC96173.1 ABC transporter permease [Streptomyces sp. ISID311]
MTSTAHLGASGSGRTADIPKRSRTAGGRGPLGGLVWLVWRQHRLVLGVLLTAAVGGTVWCAVLRGRMAGFIDAHHIAGCSQISLVARCSDTQDAVTAFRDAYGSSLRLAETGLVLLPALIGLFLGAPLIARELEAGTHQLVLTQSVGPVRWLAAKVALPAALVLAATTLLSATFAWLWQVGGDEVSGSYWYSNLGYNALGPVPVAYSLLGLAIGLLAGLLLRRTVASMGVTLAVTVLVQYVFTQLRPYLMPIVTTKFGPNQPTQLPDNAWQVGQGYYTASGAHLPDVPCRPDQDFAGCLRREHVVGQYMDQHPVTHHWPLAWTEAGIVVALAAVLTVIAFRVVRRRFG